MKSCQDTLLDRLTAPDLPQEQVPVDAGDSCVHAGSLANHELQAEMEGFRGDAVQGQHGSPAGVSQAGIPDAGDIAPYRRQFS